MPDVAAPQSAAAPAEPRALTLDQAAAEIRAMRAPPEYPQQAQDPRREPPRDDRGRYARAELGEADDARFDDDNAALEGDEDGLADEAGLDEGQDIDQDEEASDETADEPTFEVTIDGERRQVTQAELIKGFQLAESGYKRLAEASEQRQQVEALRQRVDTERMAYTHLLKQVGDWVAGQAPSAEQIEQMFMQDPVQGYQARQLREQILAKAEQFRSGYAAMIDGASTLEQRAQSEALAKAQAALPTLIPEWRDDAVRAQELNGIAVYMLREGFSAEELASIADARAMKLARKAWLFDQLQAKGGARFAAAKAQRPQQTARPNPQSTRPAPLQPGVRTDPGKSRRSQAIAERAKATGSLEDVAAWIAADRPPR